MRSHDLVLGRSFAIAFDHGEDFFEALSLFCRTNQVRQGFIPMFIAGFAEVELVGTCGRFEEPDRPLWSSVHLTHAEVFGGGTIAYDQDQDQISPHVHVTVGLKAHSATAHTSHLLSAKVQFLTEMILVEVVQPGMVRRPREPLFDVPLLGFDAGAPA